MERKRVLTEIVFSDDVCKKGYCLQVLDYGNRLIRYLYPEKKRRVIANLSNKENVEVIVCCRDTAKIITEFDFPALKFIQLTSTGYDGVPIREFAQKGIKVAALRGVYDVAIAEMVLAGLLQFYRRTSNNPKRKTPDLLRRYNSYMMELFGKRAIVLGTGNIGTCIAQRLRAFGVTVEGYNQSGKCPESFDKVYTEKTKLLNDLALYDIVLSTLPLTQNTGKFCDRQFFESMGNKALFLNIGRDGTVDDDALYSVLKGKKIRGAIIDKVELLPIWPFNRFCRLPNTIVLPGIATSTVECKRRVVDQIHRNVVQFISGELCDDLI